MSTKRGTTRSGPGPGPPTIRCAIYTRKSTEEGLEQEFNSLDAQRESAEAFIASQKNEGWVCLPHRYDDGGFTGGNMERPAVKRLMADIEAGQIDCVVVYKVDRLSRSLMDFARLMELFERQRISFVSVTQQFNTTQSMGRLPEAAGAAGPAAGPTGGLRRREGFGLDRVPSSGAPQPG
jgi:site-specific DNA recombinase